MVTVTSKTTITQHIKPPSIASPTLPISSRGVVPADPATTPRARACMGMGNEPADEAVPELLPWLAVEYQKYLGKTDAQAFSAGDMADHRATYIHALLDGAPWIDAAVKGK